MAKRIIFVAGVHGVGKSNFCELLTKRFDVQHVSSISLIRIEREIGLYNKGADIEKNQDVPLNVFKAFLPEAIVVLRDEPDAIGKRIAKRDNRIYETSLIANLQEREIARATFVRERINAPLVVIEPLKNFESSVQAIARYL